MTKYFYTDGFQKFGPFSLEQLRNENIQRDTKVWTYGMKYWKKISEVAELKYLVDSIPPEINIADKEINIAQESYIAKKKSRRFSISNKAGVIMISCFILALIGFQFLNKDEENEMYQQIVESSYESDVDFQPYIDKFYRDAEIFGLFPQKPKTTIIRFAKLDQIKNATHIHGVSFGLDNDDLIEIYINPSTWEKFNKPMRYYLIYHELAHDVLNVDDLEYEIQNEGKLMFPAIASYESISMDDFIHSYQKLFEEISGNSIYDLIE